MKMIHLECPGHEDATLEGYILDGELLLGQEKKRPAIIVCPGGGYVYLSPREGEPIALAYASKGFHTFILRYSVGLNCKGFSPLEEVDWAIGLLREHAEEWNIDPEKILTCGFSAGGHVALAAGVMAKNRSNGMILSYPASYIPKTAEAEFLLKILTGKEEVTEEDAEAFELLDKIDKDAPPVFLVGTVKDALTPQGALRVANKYESLGLGYELHLFQHGPHGYSLANEVSADGSSRLVNEAYASWLDLSVEWMKKVYGKPELIEKSSNRMAEHFVKLGFVK